jgi:hypothetical protein
MSYIDCIRAPLEVSYTMALQTSLLLLPGVAKKCFFFGFLSVCRHISQPKNCSRALLRAFKHAIWQIAVSRYRTNIVKERERERERVRQQQQRADKKRVSGYPVISAALNVEGGKCK